MLRLKSALKSALMFAAFSIAYLALWLLLHNYVIAPAQMAAMGY